MEKQQSFGFWDDMLVKKEPVVSTLSSKRQRHFKNLNSIFENQKLVNNRPMPVEDDNTDEICLEGLNQNHV